MLPAYKIQKTFETTTFLFFKILLKISYFFNQKHNKNSIYFYKEIDNLLEQKIN